MEDDGDCEEEGEEDDLDEQATGDDVLAVVHSGDGLAGRDPRT